MRLVLPLEVLEACKELFRSLRGPPVGAQSCHGLGLPRHAGGTLADMAADHLQIGFFLRHVLSRAFGENHQLKIVPVRAVPSPCLTNSRVW